MTPDRNDMPPEDAENGVLSDAGSIGSSGFGILDGATAQLDIVVPGRADDDLADDDVIGDEIDPARGSAGDDPSAVRRAAELDAAVGRETGEVAIAEVETGQVDTTAPPQSWSDASRTPEDIVDVEEIGPSEPAESTAPAERAPEGPTSRRPRTGAHDVAALRAVTAPTGATPVAPVTDAVPALRSAVPTTTGSTPTTRWAAQHPDQPARPDRAHAVERVQTHQEISLTSKRLGEFDGGQETPDLLTADRLLDRQRVARPEPEGGWQHLIYSLSGKRINLGDGRRARGRKELDRRISAPLTGGARFVAVLSRKGGVGKTTVTTLLGQALADARDDRIIAIDANPDRGTLAERIARSSGRTVRDLARTHGAVNGYHDISAIVARDETRLDVLASDTDPRVSEALSDRDYHDVASLAAHYYSIVLTDTGTGIVHSVMGATLELADQLVVVAGLSVDEARLASETLTWLETNGYSEQVRGAVVVLNSSRPGSPLVREDELEAHFRTRVRAVVRMPYDAHVATGSSIAFRELQPETRHAARLLAAAVVEGLRSLAPAA